jgi:hypothetical protein
MATAAPFTPLRIGQLVRRRIHPVNTRSVGVVGGLVFGDQNLALVRWPASGSTFEPEDTLIEAFRATAGFITSATNESIPRMTGSSWSLTCRRN